MVTKKIHVVSYDPYWPKRFEAEKERILQGAGDNILSIHHIGSTSVPGLDAKPILDIVMEVARPNRVIEPLETLGYTYKGEINIPFRLYFSNKNAVHLHVYEKGNPELDLNLRFRDYLRAHPTIKQEYANLKKTLISQEDHFEKEGSRFSNYTLGKNDFIQSVLEKAHFEGLCLRKCTHLQEWRRYHELRRTLLFEPKGRVYDEHHTNLSDPKRSHFVLYKGTRIVSVAQIEFLESGVAVLRALATDPLEQRKGYGTYMLSLLEKWLFRQGACVLKTHANNLAQNFYRNLGYEDVLFEDERLLPDVVDLGKDLFFEDK